MSMMTDADEREQFSATIARMNAETRKFIAEHDKLFAEREKLAAKGRKLGRERLYTPVLAAAAVVSTTIRLL